MCAALRYDKYCPFYKTVEMMRNIATFHTLATAAVEKTASGNAEGHKITFAVIKQRMADTLYKVRTICCHQAALGRHTVQGANHLLSSSSAWLFST
jgi:V-type H+-transporting ATPase subunit A